MTKDEKRHILTATAINAINQSIMLNGRDVIWTLRDAQTFEIVRAALFANFEFEISIEQIAPAERKGATNADADATAEKIIALQAA